MLILVGQGNPGAKYAHNRHNIGFLTLAAIAARWGFGPERSRFHSQAAEGSIGAPSDIPGAPVKALLLKPQTFYNETGRAVSEAMKFYKLTPKDVVVFHAGTSRDGEGRLIASGGRVLNVCARGATLEAARAKAYAAVEAIDFPGGFHRTDIGWRALKS